MSQAHLLIRKGRIIDPASGRDEIMDLLIEKGRLARLGASLDAPGAEIFDAEGMWVLPGLVDTCVRLPSPSSIASETRAAASGGITHLCVMPDGNPVTDSTAVVRLLREQAMKAGFARVLPLGALTQGLNGEQLAEMRTLTDAGCIGLSNAGRPVQDSLTFKRCLEYAATFDLPVMLRPEDSSLSSGGCAHEGPVATRLGLPGIPALAETIDMARALLVIEQVGVRAHIHQLSCAGSVALLRQAREAGISVTADVSIHHLLLDESALANYDSRFHVRPPLRSTADRQALLAAVADGTIDAVCSQHSPMGSASKAAPFPDTQPGIAGIETLLPLLLKLVEDGDISLLRALDAITASAGRCLGQPIGMLEPGRMAHVCVVDPTRQQRPGDDWLSRGLNSPWLDTMLPGIVRLTVCDGRVTWLSD
ncbi:MAG: dihydroorotase [Alcanivoracaceae bacterium]